MKTGKIVRADEKNPDLRGDWIEVFPACDIAEISFVAAIPRGFLRPSHCAPRSGQSPLLVRLDWWQANTPKPEGDKK